MNYFFAYDKKYHLIATMAILSLLDNAQNVEKIYVLNDIDNNTKIDDRVEYIPIEKFKKYFPDNIVFHEFFPNISMARGIAAKLLPDTVHKVMYFDSDIIDLYPLTFLDELYMDDYAMASCPMVHFPWHIACDAALFNLDFIRKHHLDDRYIRYSYWASEHNVIPRYEEVVFSRVWKDYHRFFPFYVTTNATDLIQEEYDSTTRVLHYHSNTCDPSIQPKYYNDERVLKYLYKALDLLDCQIVFELEKENQSIFIIELIAKLLVEFNQKITIKINSDTPTGNSFVDQFLNPNIKAKNTITFRLPNNWIPVQGVEYLAVNPFSQITHYKINEDILEVVRTGDYVMDDFRIYRLNENWLKPINSLEEIPENIDVKKDLFYKLL